MKKKILIVDGMFPNKFTIWRNVLIKDLIQKYDTDIVVYKCGHFAGIDYEFDYDFINKECSLENYNILISDTNHKFAQKYNKNFNGLDFLGKYNFNYAFIKEKKFEIKSYDLIFYIFLNAYNLFAKEFDVSQKKNLIYLLPGGGFNFEDQNVVLDDKCFFLSSSPQTTGRLLANKKKINFLKVHGGIKFNKEANLDVKLEKNNRFSVNFSSMGFKKEKGFADYIKIAFLYKILFPFHSVDFKSIGNSKFKFLINHYPACDYKKLIEYYKNEVSVQLDLQTFKVFNGWPQGTDSIIGGCVLISRDKFNVRKSLKYGESILLYQNLLDIVFLIRKLYKNKEYYQKIQKQQRLYLLENFGYHAQQELIFNYIDRIVN